AERAPASTDEADDEAAFAKETGGGDQFAVVIFEFEGRGLCANRKNVIRDMACFQLSDGARVNGLSLSRDVPGNEFLALSVDFAQRSDVRAGSRFFEG